MNKKNLYCRFLLWILQRYSSHITYVWKSNHAWMRNLQNAQETVSKIIIDIINHIIRKFLKEKGNNFLICRSIKTCKAKNVVLRYKIMSKCVEGDSYLQKLTGSRHHRLRVPDSGADQGNTWEPAVWKISRAARLAGVICKEGNSKELTKEQTEDSMRVVPRILYLIISVPGYCCIPGLFLFRKKLHRDAGIWKEK